MLSLFRLFFQFILYYLIPLKKKLKHSLLEVS